MGTRWLTVADVALLVGESRALIRKWISRGHLVVDARGRVDGASVVRYLDERGTRGQHAHGRNPVDPG